MKDEPFEVTKAKETARNILKKEGLESKLESKTQLEYSSHKRVHEVIAKVSLDVGILGGGLMIAIGYYTGNAVIENIGYGVMGVGCTAVAGASIWDVYQSRKEIKKLKKE